MMEPLTDIRLPIFPETPGLGMKAEEEDFYSQFENKTVDKFTVVKTKTGIG